MAAAPPWSPAARGSGIRVLVDEVLLDPKSALSEVLRATPGWQVRRWRAAQQSGCSQRASLSSLATRQPCRAP